MLTGALIMASALIERVNHDALSSMFQYLSIQDCENYIVARSTSVNASPNAINDLKQSYRMRIDPAIYLSPYFKYSSEVLDSMAENGIVLSGSRALEYFVPGSTTLRSNWDFYARPDLYHVSAFIECLERNSVIFETELQRILRHIFCNKDEVLINTRSLCSILQSAVSRLSEIDRRHLARLVASIQDHTLLGHMGHQHSMTSDYIVVSETGGHIQIRDVYNTRLDALSNAQHSVKTIHGTLAHNGNAYLIRLTIRESLDCYNIVDFSSDFHSTNIQCFILGFGAVHMYSTLSSQMKAYAWTHLENRHQNQAELISNARVKYMTRGYTYVGRGESSHDIGRIRHIGDDQSRLILFPLRSGWTRETRDLFSSDIHDITWYEYHDRIDFIRGPIDVRYNLLEDGIDAFIRSFNDQGADMVDRQIHRPGDRQICYALLFDIPPESDTSIYYYLRRCHWICNI